MRMISYPDNLINRVFDSNHEIMMQIIVNENYKENVERAIDSLHSEQQKVAIRARFRDRELYNSIAKKLGLSFNATKALINQALIALKSENRIKIFTGEVKDLKEALATKHDELITRLNSTKPFQTTKKPGEILILHIDEFKYIDSDLLPLDMNRTFKILARSLNDTRNFGDLLSFSPKKLQTIHGIGPYHTRKILEFFDKLNKSL